MKCLDILDGSLNRPSVFGATRKFPLHSRRASADVEMKVLLSNIFDARGLHLARPTIEAKHNLADIDS